MTILKKADVILGRAQELSATANSWVEFSNALFAEPNGIVSQAFPRMTERQQFYNLDQYEQINSMLSELITKFGIDEGKAPKKSGKFLVRLPKTLHNALDVEAAKEGVSLNQLAVAKLSNPLGEPIGVTTSRIVKAYCRVYDGYSTDRVIVDPNLNSAFLDACRREGAVLSDYDLNLQLQRIRKSGKALLPPATKKPQIKDYDEFVFASEIAFRYLQRRDGVTLDEVLCDPEIRRTFDDIAKRLAPNESELRLRMGALYLRKTHRLSSNVPAKTWHDFLRVGSVNEVDIESLPEFPGLYVFHDQHRPIFAGESVLLRNRINHHLHGGTGFLPSWLELGSEHSFELKYMAVPNSKSKDRMAWLNGFINRERPLLNYQRAA